MRNGGIHQFVVQGGSACLRKGRLRPAQHHRYESAPASKTHAAAENGPPNIDGFGSTLRWDQTPSIDTALLTR